MSRPQVFRANVGVIVIDEHGDVLALERHGFAGSWQLPQGGLDAGEEPLDAALRELEEETGLTANQVEHVGTHPGWLAYELPPAARKAHRGQVQKWFLFRIKHGIAVDLARATAGEFDAFKWMTLSALAAEVWEIRRPIYDELARHFADHLRQA